MKATRVCSFPGCGRRPVSRGLCDAHRKQAARGSRLSPIKALRSDCDIEGCDRKHHAAGLCSMHYGRLLKNGDPAVVRRIRGDDRARFESHVDKSGECWLWTSTRNPDGYGLFKVGDRGTGAHRFAYEFYVGAIPDGLQLDHLCRVRACVNPAHLEPVTAEENRRRAYIHYLEERGA